MSVKKGSFIKARYKKLIKDLIDNSGWGHLFIYVSNNENSSFIVGLKTDTNIIYNIDVDKNSFDVFTAMATKYKINFPVDDRVRPGSSTKIFHIDHLLNDLKSWIQETVVPFIEDQENEIEWKQFEKYQEQDLGDILQYTEADVVLEDKNIEQVKLLLPAFVENVHNTLNSSPEEKEKSEELVVRFIHEIEIKQKKKEAITRGDIIKMGSNLIINQLLQFPYEHWKTIMGLFKDAIVQYGPFLLT